MNRESFIELLFKRAKAAGFTAWEAYFRDGSAFEVGVNRGELIRYSVSDSLNFGFRGLYNGRMGCASTQVLDAEAAEMLVSAARSGAELCEGEDEEFIFEGSPAYPEWNGAHPEIDALSAGDKIAMARALEQKALDCDPKIASVRDCCLFTGASDQRLVNSRGLDLRARRDYLGAYVCPIARDGDRTGTAGRDCFVTDPAAVDLDALAQEASAEALAFLDAASVPSGNYPILLRPDAAAELMRAFASLFSADAAQKGLSLLRGREGEAIAAPCVTLVDDPLLPGGFASRAFDGEGVAARKTVVVDGGRLQTLLHNLKTAHRQGVSTTGSAARCGVAGPMTVAPSNLCFAPGALDAAGLRAQAGDALLVTDLMGLHSGANAVSGDFSLGAKGFLIRSGRIDRPVNQITVAGNFFALLKDIEATGSDLRRGASSFVCPTLLLRSLAVAGRDAAR